jgi:hypothetical protein
MIDIQQNLSTIIIFVLICIIIYLGYNYYLFKQKILLLEKNITELNKIKYLENIPNTDNNLNNTNANVNTNANTNANTNLNTNLNSVNMLYQYEQYEQCEKSLEKKDINYQTNYNKNLKKQNNIIDITNCQNEYSDNENYKLLNNNTIEDYGVIPINLNLLLHTAVQNKIDNNINKKLSESDSESDSEAESKSDSESESKFKFISDSESELKSKSILILKSNSNSESNNLSEKSNKSCKKSISERIEPERIESIESDRIESDRIESNKIIFSETYHENNLKNKNIIDIKEIAKHFGIKLSDKGKQKNKDILIQDILIVNK